jgi:hypothetical protein
VGDCGRLECGKQGIRTKFWRGNLLGNIHLEDEE